MLVEVVGAMVSARRSCTDNNTPAGRGFRSWDDGTRRLREIALPKGLKKSDEHQISCVVDLERRIKFAVMNTDDGTGLEKPGPQPTRRKGAVTTEVVNAGQGSLFEDFDDGDNVIALTRVEQHPHIYVWWYLCVFSAGDHVRAELCSPKGYRHGRFNGLYERLVLIGPDDDALKADRDDDSGDDEFEISVTRK